MRPIPFKKSKEEHKREAVGKLESSKFAEAQKLSETVMRDSYKLLKKMVGARGFEPRASCSRSRRATKLRYAPTEIALLILNHFRILQNSRTPPERAKYPSIVTKP